MSYCDFKETVIEATFGKVKSNAVISELYDRLTLDSLFSGRDIYDLLEMVLPEVCPEVELLRCMEASMVLLRMRCTQLSEAGLVDYELFRSMFIKAPYTEGKMQYICVGLLKIIEDDRVRQENRLREAPVLDFVHQTTEEANLSYGHSDKQPTGNIIGVTRQTGDSEKVSIPETGKRKPDKKEQTT